MHKDLELAFEKLVAILVSDIRCMGGWHYGSISRGEQDDYSDYDPVFLVDNQDFEAFAADVPKVFEQVCDELLLFWAESFNDSCFKNYCSVIRIGANLHQLDFFIINKDFPDAWMCRQHCKGCNEKHIIFDRHGKVLEFLKKGYCTDNDIPDAVRAMDTYWLHAEMLIKYFKRRDIFKLLKNVDVIFHAHVDLLLSHYDTIDWGAWESKVKHCVPKDKQDHLTGYFTCADFDAIKKMIKTNMIIFRRDAKEICNKKKIDYPDRIAEQVITYFNERMESED